MPEQPFRQGAIRQTEQLIFSRCPEHYARPNHSQKLIASGIFQHTAQVEVAVHQHTVVVKTFEQRRQALLVRNRIRLSCIVSPVLWY
jgi:hypothetical protein